MRDLTKTDARSDKDRCETDARQMRDLMKIDMRYKVSVFVDIPTTTYECRAEFDSSQMVNMCRYVCMSTYIMFTLYVYEHII
jgi:hypothetical protein